MRFGTARFALLALVASMAVPGVAAQDAAWSTLRISVAGAESVTRVGMHTWWRPTTGAALRVEAPFEGGFLEAGARFMPLGARTDAVPSYTALLAWAGWGGAWRPVRPVRLSAALRAGMLRMDFAEDIAFAGVRSESELTLGGAARLEIVLSGRLGVFAEAAAERTLTAIEIDQVHASAGLLLRVGAPRWVREVLR